jgi:DNA (cytosine-5)-methyltransferase 1
LLLENVKNLVGKQFKSQFEDWLFYLDELGYDTYWQVLNAKNYGIPQNRERVFAISIRKDLNQSFEFPQIEELKIRLKDVLEDEVNEKFYINSDKINNLILNIKNKFEKQQCSYCIDANYWKGGTAEQFLNKSRRQLVVIGSTQKNAYIGDGEMSPTLTSAMGMGGGHVPMVVFEDIRIRKLTPLECWRLMGFDDEDFYKAQKSGVSNSQLYKQAGNSIVVNVLEKIFKNLF